LYKLLTQLFVSFFPQLVPADNARLRAAACEKIEAAGSPEEMNVLLPEIRQTVLDNWKAPDADPEFPERHCVRWCLVPEKKWCYLHFHNSISPGSFLQDPAFMKKELLREIGEAAEKEACDMVYTASWLNSLPAFLRFFPPQWSEHRYDPEAGDVGPSRGWQGQFINRSGALNRPTADWYLRYGVLKYPRMASFCPLALLRDFLNS